ncbi:MAG: preprotein translocase subunit YajC [Alphaproteobacteria bacterium]|nr:preprotein translocase subunit YajC [Alphaproteobacteria bacterium]
MLINAAYAQVPGASPGGSDFMLQLLPLLLIFAVFYFLLIRPQQKKARAHKEMLVNLKRGDRVLTGGGFFGVITKVDGDDSLMVELAPGMRVKVARNTIADVVARGEPVERGKKVDEKDGDKGTDSGKGADSGPSDGPSDTEKKAAT